MTIERDAVAYGCGRGREGVPVKLRWRKNRFTGAWESTDGQWEISPVYEPSLRGGSLSRATTWRAKSKGRREPLRTSWRYLSDAKAWCQTQDHTG